jgi:hypothetical protein
LEGLVERTATLSPRTFKLISLWLLRFGPASRNSFFQGNLKAVEPRFPQATKIGEPSFKFDKRFLSERVQSALLIGPHRHESGIVKYPQMPGNTRLVDAGMFDNLAYLPLS